MDMKRIDAYVGLTDKNHKPISESSVKALARSFVKIAGGFTRQDTHGEWVDEGTKRKYIEKGYHHIVYGEDKDVDAIKAAIKRFLKDSDQKAAVVETSPATSELITGEEAALPEEETAVEAAAV